MRNTVLVGHAHHQPSTGGYPRPRPFQHAGPGALIDVLEDLGQEHRVVRSGRQIEFEDVRDYELQPGIAGPRLSDPAGAVIHPEHLAPTLGGMMHQVPAPASKFENPATAQPGGDLVATALVLRQLPVAFITHFRTFMPSQRNG